MLSKPFGGLSRGALVVVLVILVALEGAGAVGLYLGNHTASANSISGGTATPGMGAPATAAPDPTTYNGPPILTVQNFPRTVIAGHYETFSVRLRGLAHVLLTYRIGYPDGSTDAVKVLTDSTGYSKHSFLITYNLGASHRAPITIGVSYSQKLQAYTRFAVQAPDPTKTTKP
ncbi:MAG TPA: hypothetical protein VNL35_05185 [Chloroflexota bacterium]|nr:hypothetical protein [Chloroflexota bacterium]